MSRPLLLDHGDPVVMMTQDFDEKLETGGSEVIILLG